MTTKDASYFALVPSIIFPVHFDCDGTLLASILSYVPFCRSQSHSHTGKPKSMSIMSSSRPLSAELLKTEYLFNVMYLTSLILLIRAIRYHCVIRLPRGRMINPNKR